MSALQRLVLIVPLALGAVAVAADNPDAPDRASEVLEILTRSKKIAEQEKSDEQAPAKTEDKSAEKATEEAPAKTPTKDADKPADQPAARTGEPDGDASVDRVQQVIITPPSTSTPAGTEPAKTGSTQTQASAPEAEPAPPASNQPLRIAPAQPADAAANRPAATEYTLQPGDTFSSIAKDLYGDEKKWTAIAQANPLVDPRRLKVGQVIRLPDLAQFARQREQQLEQIKQAVSRPTAEARTVIVQPGDTLSHIARRVYGDGNLWNTIYQANKDQLDTPDRVKVGMKLVIPPKPQ